MAQIKQVGVGRKTTGTIDGITYYVRGGVTYARSTPTMPASVYNTVAAKKRQAIFKMVQMHLKLHIRTIKQTFTPLGNFSSINRYYSMNGRALTLALATLAEQYVAGVDITITDVENAISAYAAEHPQSIKIASKSGYQEVYLTGVWPETITLNASTGDSTVIIIIAENGTTTTINPNGTVTTGNGQQGGGQSSGQQTSDNGQESGGNGQQTGGNGQGSGSETVAAPTVSGTTPFEETTTVTMSGPAGAEIHYTTDGSAPSSESTLYSAALTLNETTTVKAVAVMNGSLSAVTTKVFVKGSGADPGDPENSED